MVCKVPQAHKARRVRRVNPAVLPVRQALLAQPAREALKAHKASPVRSVHKALRGPWACRDRRAVLLGLKVRKALLGLRASLAPKVCPGRLAQSDRSDHLALPDRLGLPVLLAVLLVLPAQQVLQVQPDRLAQLDHKARKAQLAPRVPQVRLDHRVVLLVQQVLLALPDRLGRKVILVVAEVADSVLLRMLLPFLGQLRLIL